MIYTGRLFHEDSQFQQASIVCPLPSRLTMTKESDMIDTCLCYFVVFPNPPGVFSHQNMIPQSHPLGVRRGLRELGVQVAGKLVAVWYQALWQNQRCVCLQVFFLFIKNCISISIFISNLANLLIIRSFLPTFHLP